MVNEIYEFMRAHACVQFLRARPRRRLAGAAFILDFDRVGASNTLVS